MDLTEYKITNYNGKDVASAPDVLTGTIAQNKAVFDALTKEVVVPKHNAMAEAIGPAVPTILSADGALGSLASGRYLAAATLTLGLDEQHPGDRLTLSPGDEMTWDASAGVLTVRGAAGTRRFSTGAGLSETGGVHGFTKALTGNTLSLPTPEPGVPLRRLSVTGRLSETVTGTKSMDNPSTLTEAAPATLSAYASNNLFVNKPGFSINGLVWDVLPGGGYHVYGTKQAATGVSFDVAGGTAPGRYTVSANFAQNLSDVSFKAYMRETNRTVYPTAGTNALTVDVAVGESLTVIVEFRMANGTTVDKTIKMCVHTGARALPYENYTAPETLSLPMAVGTLSALGEKRDEYSLLTGKLTRRVKAFAVTGGTVLSAQNDTYICCSAALPVSADATVTPVCNYLPMGSAASLAGECFSLDAGHAYFCLRKNRFATAAAFNAWLALAGHAVLTIYYAKAAETEENVGATTGADVIRGAYVLPAAGGALNVGYIRSFDDVYAEWEEN
ncbi:MAG: hypothetical protein KIG36_02880 [Eubacteriales bacterium]|nr:hypothetical protein [Eubacteriales bacterium]